MTRDEMKRRTKQYGLRVIRAVQALPENPVGRTLSSQLVRSGTSVGANYRAACRARSMADFVNKLKIVEEECDESLFWMELIMESEMVPENRLRELMREGDEILAITVASLKTLRSSHPRKS